MLRGWAHGRCDLPERHGRGRQDHGVPHALVDLDHIRRLWPAPAGDPFNLAVELRNPRSIVANYRDAGSRRLILAGVIERAADLVRYHEALGTTELFL